METHKRIKHSILFSLCMSCAALPLSATVTNNANAQYIHCPQTGLLFWLNSKGTFNVSNANQASILQDIQQYAQNHQQDNSEIQDPDIQKFFAWYCEKRLCNQNQKFWTDFQNAKSNAKIKGKKGSQWNLYRWRSQNKQVQSEIRTLDAAITCYNAWLL